MTDKRETKSSTPNPMFTIAAWLSLFVPLLAAAWAFYVASTRAPGRDTGLTKPILIVLAVVFGLSFVTGCISLRGVKTNGALVILPPAILGMLISAALELLALIFLALTGLPGP
ncbi:MAG: hypothetical protein ACJ8FY_07680 [Gemmataceae bacterium]